MRGPRIRRDGALACDTAAMDWLSDNHVWLSAAIVGFIIVVALESLVIGVALIVLIVQLASLINLLQNEVRPILKATSDTVNNLRGTAEFLGENVVEPVVKLNGYLAGLYRMLELMGLKKK